MECPGQDSLFWKPDDVFEISCPKCSYKVEFFKYDVKRKCPCGHEMVNPRLDFGCAQWCSYGDRCLESLPEEVRAVQLEAQNSRLRQRILKEMEKIFGKDDPLIDHALLVARYAEEILKIEGGHPLVVFGAAYLHILKESQTREKEPLSAEAETGEILRKLNIQREIADEIGRIVASRPLLPGKDPLASLIFADAHGLAEREEARRGGDKPAGNEEVLMKTATGKRLGESLP